MAPSAAVDHDNAVAEFGEEAGLVAGRVPAAERIVPASVRGSKWSECLATSSTCAVLISAPKSLAWPAMAVANLRAPRTAPRGRDDSADCVKD